MRKSIIPTILSITIPTSTTPHLLLVSSKYLIKLAPSLFDELKAIEAHLGTATLSTSPYHYSTTSLSSTEKGDSSDEDSSLLEPSTARMTTPTTNQYQLNGPTFAFCGTFSGTGTTSASRWLKKFEHELAGYKTDDGSIPPKVYLANLDMLLEDEASEWSESQPEAIRLLALADPTQDDVTMFKSLLCERFPSKAVELYPVPFSVELSELKQKDEESLNSYYKRVSTLMQRVGAKDRPQAPVAIGVQPGLSMLEAAMLDTILYAFIKGLNDTAVRKEATRAMTSSDRSLKTVYNTAEEARRTNIEIETMLREEQKADKLQFYMDLASRNVPKHQMDSLLAEYHAKKSTEGKPSSAWSFYVDPPQQVPEPAAYTAPAQAPAPIYTKPDNQRSVLTTNQNAQNRRTPGNSYGRRPNRDYEAKPLPAASSSKNPWINGSKQWDISKDGPLCYQCGNCGHIKRDCKDDVLPAWEQSHLKAIVFPNITAQANFVAAAYGEYDGHVYPYGSEGYGTGYHDQSGSSNSRNTPQTGAGSTSSNSIQVCMPSHTSEANSVEAYYGEGSGPNKRPHVEPEMNASNAGPSTSAPANPYPTFAGQYPQFQAQQPTEGRTRAKAQKKVGRKLEPQPLVGMFNDGLGKYDSPVSIRSLLQNNKVDISWMDLVAWSPAVAREIKRMCTRVSKKKTPRARNRPAATSWSARLNLAPIPDHVWVPGPTADASSGASNDAHPNLSSTAR